MTLRTRFALIIAALLTVSIVVVALVNVRVSENALLDAVDDQLFGALADRDFARQPDAEDAPEGAGPDENGRGMAVLRVRPDGTVVALSMAGPRDAPLALPDLDMVELEPLTPQTVAAVDDTLRYRILPSSDRAVRKTVLAVSMIPTDNAIASIRRTALLTGFLAVLLGAALGWIAVRRETAKLDEVLGVADAVAAGDLSARLSAPEPDSEIGRIKLGLNAALDHVEEAVTGHEAAKTRLRMFVDDVAHEVRTPSTTIAGWTELYDQGAIADDAGVEKMIRRVQGENRRVLNLVDEMVLLARQDTSRPAVLEPVDLLALITDVVDDATTINPQWPISISGEEELHVLADQLRLEQVFINVIDNVRMHNPPGVATQIDIRSVVDKGTPLVRIEVRDDGVGIPSDQVDRVLGRSVRGPSASGTGRGLGLAIVQSIVDDHRGSLRLSSDTRGTTIRIDLPSA